VQDIERGCSSKPNQQSHKENIPNNYVPTVPTPVYVKRNIDEFENADADEFKQRNDTERIVSFLDRNDDRAWKTATVAERLGLETDAVSAILSRLKDRELVRHKRPYWAITDDKKRLQSAYRLHRHHKTADDQYGEERLEDLRTEDTEEVQ